MRVVAEGVETADAWDALAGLHCDEAQGFFLGRPMTATALGGLDARARGSEPDHSFAWRTEQKVAAKRPEGPATSHSAFTVGSRRRRSWSEGSPWWLRLPARPSRSPAARGRRRCPPQQPGVTLRTYQLGTTPNELCTIKAGTTPNVDKVHVDHQLDDRGRSSARATTSSPHVLREPDASRPRVSTPSASAATTARA